MSDYLRQVNGTVPLDGLTVAQQERLCGELRTRMMEVVSVNGGHLSASLGAVELTVAIHKCFDLPKDTLIFDVGHQCYAHKMLTGRLEEFETLRREGGISGFPKPSESPYDSFIEGHASTSISQAVGLCRAKLLTGDDSMTIAVIGDGALTGGLAFEGLNNAGQSREPLVIVLNDNGIAINHTVGGMAKYLTRQRVRPAYYRLKRAYRKVLLKTRIGTRVFEVTQRWKNKLKAAIFSCTAFEEMGFRYLGPVDGHNVRQLSYMLNVARSYREPVLLHVVTQKGKGYPDAERRPALYHSVGPFDPEKGAEPGTKACFSTVFGEEILRLAEKDARICVITAAMEEGTGLQSFPRSLPERFFDEGIAEGRAAAMAAGMAKQGLKPVFAVYSTFLQRSYDMLQHDVALLHLPVVLAVDRCGLVGADGETHNGVFDVGFLRQVPGMQIWCPASYQELRDMLAEALKYDGPSAVRYPRGQEGEYRDGGVDAVRVLRDGKDLTIICYGTLVNEALRASDILEKEEVSARVVKLGRIAPLDLETLEALTCLPGGVLVAEECAAAGSVGEALALAVGSRPFRALNLGDGVVRQGTPAQQRRRAGVDAEAIVRAAVEMKR